MSGLIIIIIIIINTDDNDYDDEDKDNDDENHSDDKDDGSTSIKNTNHDDYSLSILHVWRSREGMVGSVEIIDELKAQGTERERKLDPIFFAQKKEKKRKSSETEHLCFPFFDVAIPKLRIHIHIPVF